VHCLQRHKGYLFFRRQKKRLFTLSLFYIRYSSGIFIQTPVNENTKAPTILEPEHRFQSISSLAYSQSLSKKMQFSISHILAVSVTLLSTFSMVSATPVPCTDVSLHLLSSFFLSQDASNSLQRVRDLVLRGDLDPSACCSYGVCKGDVNVQGA
jgi:hypothetical protein